MQEANTEFVMCVFASAQNNSALNEWIFMTFYIPVFFENL